MNTENLTILRSFGILYRTFLSYVSKSIAERDLSFSDYVFLVNIGANEGISQEEIAKSLAIDKAAVARSVKGMEKKGYVVTKKSASDGRAKELYLSSADKKEYRFMIDLQEKWLKQVLADAAPGEIKSFAKLINTFGDRAKDISTIPEI